MDTHAMAGRSDSDVIVRLLKTAERRIRRNRILNDTATGLACAFVIPVVFKLIDLISPFRGIAVALFLGAWAAVTALWLATRPRHREPLEKTAAQVDRAAGAQDQLQTAYWFIRNPEESPWIATQIHQASENAARIQVAQIYPRHVPRALLGAAGLVLIFGALNFLPLSLNPNWLLLKGAPAFRLNNAQNAEMQKALELLKQAAALNQTDIADRLAGVVAAVRNGSMSQGELSRNLSAIQKSIAQDNLDAADITGGLEQVAKALDPSAFTKPVAGSLFVQDLKGAAKESRRIEDSLEKTSEAALNEMAERFQAAASAADSAAGKDLKPLADSMKSAAGAMNSRNVAAGRQALEQTAKEFERLQGVLDSQRLQTDASAQIDAVQDSVGGTPQEASGGGKDGKAGEDAGGSSKAGQGDGRADGPQEGRGEGSGFDLGDTDGDQPGTGNGAGGGGNQAGLSGPPPARGEPTELAVQLEKEALPIKPTRGSRPESTEEASQRERSKLEYGKSPDTLRTTSKDLLHPDSVPLDQQQLLKQYFESIRP